MTSKTLLNQKPTNNFEVAANNTANGDGLEKSEKKCGKIELQRNYKAFIKSLTEKNETVIQNIFKFCKGAKSKLQLNNFFKKDLDSFFVGCEVDIEISKMLTFLAYFWQSVDYIESLSDDMRVIVLEEPGNLFEILCSATKLDGLFYKSFCHIVNRKYDGKFITSLSADLCNFMNHAIGVFIKQMFFIIEQCNFLAVHYYKQKNLTMYRFYLQKAFLIFKQMKTQLVGKECLIDMLIKRIYRQNFDTNILLGLKTKIAEMIYPEIDVNYFHIAALKADFKFLQVELSKTFLDLNSTDSVGFTALHCAVYGGNAAVVERLLSYESLNVNAQSKAGLTPLHIAAITDSVNVLQVLLKSPKIDVNRASVDGWTALHIAVAMQHRKFVAELLKAKNLDINIQMFSQITPLHISAKLDDKELIFMLLIGGPKCSATTEDGLTALDIARKYNCTEVVEMLEGVIVSDLDLPNGATAIESLYSIPGTTDAVDPLTNVLSETSLNDITNDIDNLKTAKDQQFNTSSSLVAALLEQFSDKESYNIQTQLYRAVLKGELESIKSLVTEGADVSEPHESGKNVMDFALINGNSEIFKYFLEEHKLGVPESLVFKAAEAGLFEIVRYLLEEKVLNPQQKNEEQTTLLCAAIKGGNFEIVKYLIEDHCVPVISTAENCPLCSAIEVNNLEMVKFFLNRGLNILGVCDEQRPILIAAKKASLKIFLYLLESGASIDVKSNDKGVFEYAAIGGNSEVLRYLVMHKNYALHTKISVSGLSTFFQVARAGKLKDVKYFIEEANFQVHDEGPLGGTLLHELAFNRNLEVIKYFVEKQGLNPKARDKNSFIPLFYAAQQNNLIAVKYFISERKMGLHLKDKHNRTVLHIAAMNGSLNVVRYLVEEQKANLYVQDNDGLTPLLVSAQKNTIDVLQYFLNRNCDFNLLNAEEKNILHLAAKLGNMKIIKTLVEERGMSVHSTDTAGQTPIFYAALAGETDVVQYFVDSKKVDLEVMDYNKQTVLSAVASKFVTPNQVSSNFDLIEYLLKHKCHSRNRGRILHIAAKLGNVEIIKHLIKVKAMNVDERDYENITPLHYAAENGQLDAVKYFVECAKANFNIMNKLSQTVLFSAVISNNLDVVKYLVESGADVHIKDGYKNSPVYYSKDEKVTQYLRKFCQ